MNFNVLTISTKPRTLLYAVLLVLLIFEITGHACGASPKEEWNMTHKGINMDIIDSTLQTSDGGYIIAGSTCSCDNNTRDILLVKTNQDGNKQWIRTFGVNKLDDTIEFVQQTSDGGYIVAGSTSLCEGCFVIDVWLIKTDSNGIKQWNRTFKSSENKKVCSIQPTSDNGFIITGWNVMDSTIWLLKTDPNGSEQWNKQFVGTPFCRSMIRQTSDNGFIIIGWNSTDPSIQLLKTDSSGNKQWSSILNGTKGHSPVTMQQTSDGGYIIGEWGDSYEFSRPFYSLIKIDSTGNMQWNKTFSKEYFFNRKQSFIRQTPDGGYILGSGLYYTNFRIIKIDPGGNIQWNTIFEGIDSLQPTSDGGFLLFGDQIIKAGSKGNEQWNRTCKSGLIQSILQISDGSYILSGENDSDLIVIKLEKEGPIPIASFTYSPDYPCIDQQIVFDASISYDPDGNIINYLWNFQDGNTTNTTEEIIIHSYASEGQYHVNLTVIDNDKLINSSSRDIIIRKEPQPVEIWNKTFAGPGIDKAYSVQQTRDGGYIIAGETQYYSSDYGLAETGVWLVKTDSTGNMQWNRTFIETDNLGGYCVRQTSDDGYIISVTSTNFDIDMSDFWLIKVDSSGNKQWSRIFGGKSSDKAYCAQQTSDDGFIITGKTYVYDVFYDIWLIKTDIAGNELWNKTFGGIDIDSAHSVWQTNDGGYIIAGTTSSFGDDGRNVWLVKTDPNGNEQWNKTYWEPCMNCATLIRQTHDGGYIIAGVVNSNFTDKYDICIAKTDSSGNMQWKKTFAKNTYNQAYCIKQTSDGGYIIAGETGFQFNTNAWLIKTDQGGNIQWEEDFGGSGEETARCISQTIDGGYIIAGNKGIDFWLIKLGDSPLELDKEQTLSDNQSQMANAGDPIANNNNNNNNNDTDQQWISSPIAENFYVAVGEMTTSSGVLNFNLTSRNIPDGLFYNPTTGGSFESLNFSINNECQIPATSFVYTTSMYTSDDNISRIVWLGHPYYVMDHNNKSMNITGFLVDEAEDDTRLLRDKETLVLPEGFAIFISDIFIDDGDNVAIILTQYGEEKDKQIVNKSEWYEYRSNMNGNGQTDNLILRFNVETLFCGMNYNLIKINSLQLISCDVLRINNEDTLCFSLKDSGISWHDQPYYVIDDNTTHLTIARLLIDEDAYYTYRLKKGDTLMLPDGYAITILDINPYIPLDKYRVNDFGYGQFLFSLTQYGKEIDKKVVRAIDSYEYTVDLNGNGQNDNRVMRFNVGEIFSGGRFDWVEINSIGLVSSDVLGIENSDEINIILEGYKTNIENNGTTVTVVRDDLTKNINLTKGGSTTFMDNWFNVRINSASDAVAVSSAVIISDTYELVGAVEYPYSGYGEFNLTSKDDPAILYYDLENAAGYETLNLSIDNNFEPTDPEQSYRIPAASLVYTTTVYPTRDHNDLKIAWLGEPYYVIEHDSASVLISKFLKDEHRADCYLLSEGDTLPLPDGFNLTADIINISTGTVLFLLTQNHIEIDNSTITAGEAYQYKTDMNNNGKDDNWMLRFNVDNVYLYNNTAHVKINAIQMISVESLRIFNGDVNILKDYRVDIKNEGTVIEVSFDDLNNDITLVDDEITGFLDDIFHFRVYNNGKAVSLVKVINATGLSHEFNKSSMHNASNAEGSSGFGIFVGAFILSIAVFWCKRD